MKKSSPSRKTAAPDPVPPAGTARDASPKVVRCVVCDSETQAGSPDQMCWVCRRLKISAWREIEQPAPAQE